MWRRVCGHSPAVVVDALIELLGRENLEGHEVETDRVLQALLRCRDSGRVSVPAAILWALARSAALAWVRSFGRALFLQGDRALRAGLGSLVPFGRVASFSRARAPFFSP